MGNEGYMSSRFMFIIVIVYRVSTELKKGRLCKYLLLYMVSFIGIEVCIIYTQCFLR